MDRTGTHAPGSVLFLVLVAYQRALSRVSVGPRLAFLPFLRKPGTETSIRRKSWKAGTKEHWKFLYKLWEPLSSNFPGQVPYSIHST